MLVRGCTPLETQLEGGTVAAHVVYPSFSAHNDS